MRLTRRRRRKIYKGIGVVLAIGLLVWLIMINPFQYIHIEFKPIFKEGNVLKNDNSAEEKEKEKQDKAIEEAKRKKEQEELEKKKLLEIEVEKEKQNKKDDKQEDKKKEVTEEKDTYYTVTFFNPDGSTLRVTSFKSGAMPYYSGDVPSFYDGVHYYEFIGWDKPFKVVTSNAIYVAQYKVIGDVYPDPGPTPKPKPKPDPEEPEELEDLSELDFFYIQNDGEYDGKVQILKSVADYSEYPYVPEGLKQLSATEIHLQYSFDMKEWKDFNAYSEYDLWTAMTNIVAPDFAEYFPNLSYEIVDSENAIVLKPKQKIYFRTTPGFDNRKFVDVISVDLVEETRGSMDSYPIPCINIFDLRGVDEFNSTKFSIGGDLTSLLDDDFISEISKISTNGTIVTSFDGYGLSGLFANISESFIRQMEGIDDVVVEEEQTHIEPAYEVQLENSYENKQFDFFSYVKSLFTDFFNINDNKEQELEIEQIVFEKRKKEGDLDIHNGDNLVSAKELVFPEFAKPDYGYCFMFGNSSRLENAPDIGQVKVGDYAFNGAFLSCASLNTYPYSLTNNIRGENDPKDKNKSCYKRLFEYCTNLNVVGKSNDPFLPAEHLSESCYESMFHNTPLESSPKLSATDLAPSCYKNMFKHTLITNLPDLRATDLTNCDKCYQGMFSDCSNITSVDDNYLSSTLLSSFCYSGMFANSGITSVPNLYAEKVYEGSYERMFENCQNIVNGPIIKVNSFDEDINPEHYVYPFDNMFCDCTNLRNVTLDSIDIDEDNAQYFVNFLLGTNSLIGGTDKRVLYINDYISEGGSPVTQDMILEWLYNNNALDTDSWCAEALK